MDVMDQLEFLLQVFSDFEDEKVAGVRGARRLKVKTFDGRNGSLDFFPDVRVLDL
jgi:hypothetical protein